MKKIIFTTLAIFIVALNMKALEPVRIGLNYPNPSGSLKIKLMNGSDIDPGTGEPRVITERTISDVSANSSGVVSLVVGENDPDWRTRPQSLSSNTSILIRVYDEDDNFIKQFVYRDLVSIQSTTGNGGVLDDGFNSTNGLTTSGETADDFLFGATAIPFVGFGGFVAEGDDTKFFFKNDKGAIRAGAVTGTSWDIANLGEYSTGFGYNTEASGQASFASGDGSVASGINSTAMGDFTEASGVGSFAIGGYSIASGDLSAAIGVGLIAESFSEIVVGSYNTTAEEIASTEYFDYDDRLFIIGNGFDGEGITRSDAMVVYKSGDTEINGDLTVSAYFAANGVYYPDDSGEDGQILTYDSDNSALVWSDPESGSELFFNEDYFNGDGTEGTPYSVEFITDGTLTGNPFLVEGSLGVDLTASNTWSGDTEFDGSVTLNGEGFTGGDKALFVDTDGTINASSGSTAQSKIGIHAGTYAWDSNQTTNTVSDAAIDANSVITLTFEGTSPGTPFTIRIVNLTTGQFDIVMDGQGPQLGTIHYMIINQ